MCSCWPSGHGQLGPSGSSVAPSDYPTLLGRNHDTPFPDTNEEIGSPCTSTAGAPCDSPRHASGAVIEGRWERGRLTIHPVRTPHRPSVGYGPRVGVRNYLVEGVS